MQLALPLRRTGVILAAFALIMTVDACKSKQEGPPKPMVTQGRVYDMIDSLPIAGARILLVEPQIGITTDSAGFYQIANMPSARYTIEVSHLGYETLRQNHIIIGDGDTNHIDFYLLLAGADDPGVLDGGDTARP